MALSLKLHSPRGYGPVVPLEPRRHAGMGLKPRSDHRWAAGLNALPISASEFFKAGLDYPIAFARKEREGEFIPVIATGLREHQNLYIAADGSWRPQTYVPAYVRRFPFCIAPVPGQEKGSRARPLVCVQEDQLEANSPRPLFDPSGAPAAAWKPLQELLDAVEAAHQQTRVLCRRLEALGLLVPFEALATPRQGAPSRLQGLFRVDEQKLAKIPGRDLRTMMNKGELRAVYAHLNSLENFGRLLDLDQAGASR
ncbi:hypothetical protein C3942_18680 [Solimonas fluminis]|uniref:SapC family protein n=1 Tax=Solimonas fluminis TaxID=2086571 RepID=A0A2S5TBK7_9GAMM|nr:SapC family protein [Solimonas fluminis]PPE72342.1 hypothetical protein C3942_18680 [Solimonas fluminis]